MAQHNPAVDQLFSVAYEELRRLAATVLRDEAQATLTPTALVNEAYLRLAESLRIQPESRLHFKRIVARAMRQVLVDSARRRTAMKRGGGAFVTLDESLDGTPAGQADVLALHSALEALARVRPRQAEVIECRFFGGFDVAETALLLGVSEVTVARDWRAGRAWLALELRGGS